jgi:hypothetical protein
MVVVLFVLNLVRVILYAVEGTGEAELIGGLVLMLCAPSLKCLVCIGPLKRGICVLSLVMTYLTIVEWSLSFADFYGYENRALWLLLVSLVTYQGGLLLVWSFLAFAGVVVLFTVYAIVRVYTDFGDLDLPGCILTGVLPILLCYVKHLIYRTSYDTGYKYKDEAF